MLRSIATTLVRAAKAVWNFYADSERLEAWDLDTIDLSCRTCGLSDDRPVQHYVSAYGPKMEIRKIVDERRARCGRKDCQLGADVIERLAVPGYYR